MSINGGRRGLAKHALISVAVGSPPQLALANHFKLAYHSTPNAASTITTT